jgi:hypothetical protein
MSESDYYRARIAQELAAAEFAADPSISQIHREMARRYHERLSDGAIMPWPAERQNAEPEHALG